MIKHYNQYKARKYGTEEHARNSFKLPKIGFFFLHYFLATKISVTNQITCYQKKCYFEIIFWEG